MTKFRKTLIFLLIVGIAATSILLLLSYTQDITPSLTFSPASISLTEGESVEVKIVANDASEYNVVAIKLELEGDLKLTDVSYPENALTIPKGLEDTSLDVDVAFTELFGKDQVEIATLAIESTGDKPGMIRFTEGSSVAAEATVLGEFHKQSK